MEEINKPPFSAAPEYCKLNSCLNRFETSAIDRPNLAVKSGDQISPRSFRIALASWPENCR